ncbi:Hypothetical predicted protein [Paramuricea clavata]|uniref:Uncharacterized protein n=1 Tax=Paramuricea clavata TaxID=317549 RepID=A0A6S7GB68_PARCT|nr:Hypothetical predicted protein [Paramuricea clavata]
MAIATEIRESIEFIAHVKEKAVLRSFGVTVESDSDDAYESEESCSDAEYISETDVRETCSDSNQDSLLTTRELATGTSSESPTQAFVATILWLYRKFKGMKNEFSDDDIRQAMSSICHAYDNMCHMDSLKIAKRDFPLPKPFDECWTMISKVIDRLCLRNHVDPKCERMYNADEKVPPQFKTMACEQTFIWASRFKKVMCAMPHVRQFFFLHRLVKYRNRYTEKYHRLEKVPILPKIGKSKEN